MKVGNIRTKSIIKWPILQIKIMHMTNAEPMLELTLLYQCIKTKSMNVGMCYWYVCNGGASIACMSFCPRFATYYTRRSLF